MGAGHPQNSNAEEQEGWPGPSPSPCLGDNAASSGEEERSQEARAEEMEVRVPDVDASLARTLPCGKAWGSAHLAHPASPRMSWT